MEGQLPKQILAKTQICLKGTLLVKFIVYLLCTRCFTCIILFNLPSDPVLQISNLTEVTKQKSSWARV